MKNRLAIILLALVMCLSLGAAAEETLTLTFVGDVSIGDAIQHRSWENSYHSVVAQKGMDWPFSLVAEQMRASDITIANLEGTITTRTRHRDVYFPLVIDPAHTQILLSGGIDVVNTANNHAMDFYKEGYAQTLEHLDQAGIAHFGTLSPPGTTKVNRQVILERKGVRIGFIGFTYPQESDLRHIEKATRELRDAGCDLVILSLHWGRETYLIPDGAQYSFARKVLKFDIDLIYGHHPHVVQPIALYQGKPVLFSTGNFTFGAMSKVDPSTGLFQVSYDLSGDRPRLAAIRVIPLETRGTGDYRPTPVTDEAAQQAIFRKLTLKRPPKDFENMPDSFLTTGEAVFAADK